MTTWRVWFKDYSAVLVHAENEIIAKAKAQEIADRNQGPKPTYQDEVKQWRAAKTIARCERLAV